MLGSERWAQKHDEAAQAVLGEERVPKTSSGMSPRVTGELAPWERAGTIATSAPVTFGVELAA